MQKRTALMRTIIAIVIVTLALAHIFAGQGQISENQTAENVIALARKAKVQVENEIDSVYSNAEALQKVVDANLGVQLERNVSLYNQSAVLLNKAEAALENANYNLAISSSQEALQGFGRVLKSINWILLDVGLKTNQGIDASSVLDAVNRTLERIAHLRLVLPANATDQVALLDQAEAALNIEETERLISEGNISAVAENLNMANELLSQVYEYLKVLAEDSNAARISGYLHEVGQARERIRERIGYAGSQGLNVTKVFEALGYHNEAEFMNALQNITQIAQGKMGDLEAVMQDLEVLSRMVQQLNQTLTQEMNRHQNQGGSSGNGNNWNSSQGSGNTGPANGTTTPGTGGNSGSGASDSGSGSNSTSDSGSGTTGEGNGPANTETPGTGNNSSPSSSNETGNNNNTPPGSNRPSEPEATTGGKGGPQALK